MLFEIDLIISDLVDHFFFFRRAFFSATCVLIFSYLCGFNGLILIVPLLFILGPLQEGVPVVDVEKVQTERMVGSPHLVSLPQRLHSRM